MPIFVAAIEEAYPLVAFLVAMLIPIVFLLTRHQRQMAELMHRNRLSGSDQERILEQKVAHLTEAVHAQTLAIEDLRSRIESKHVVNSGETVDLPTYLSQEK